MSGIAITGKFKRGENDASSFLLIDENGVPFHYRRVTDNTARDTMPAYLRVSYMLVYSIGANKTYRLGSDVTISGQVWTEESGSFIPLTQKGANDGVVPLNSQGKIDIGYLDTISLSSSFAVDDIPAMLALTTYTGNIIVVIDASIDPNVTSGSASYVKKNDVANPAIEDFLKLEFPVSVSSVNGLTGTVSIDFTTLLTWGSAQAQFDAAVAGHSSVTANAAAIVTNAADIVTLTADKANKNNVLELDNTTVFVPSGDYNPATKKYVDDAVGVIGFTPSTLLIDYSFTDNSGQWNTAFGWGNHTNNYWKLTGNSIVVAPEIDFGNSIEDVNLKIFKGDVGGVASIPLFMLRTDSARSLTDDYSDTFIGPNNGNPAAVNTGGNIGIGSGNLTSILPAGTWNSTWKTTWRGDRNIAIGNSNGSSLIGSTDERATGNTLIGQFIMSDATDPSYNQFIGYYTARYFNVPFNGENGQYNVALGSYALYSAITSGAANYNTAIGPNAMWNTPALSRDNTAIGDNAMGETNFVVTNPSSDGFNTGVGASSLRNAILLLKGNTGVGTSSGRHGGGTDNTYLGRSSGWSMRGTGNTSVGYQAAHNPTNTYSASAGTPYTGSNSLFLGYRAGYATASAAISNVIVIGNNYQPVLTAGNTYIQAVNDIILAPTGKLAYASTPTIVDDLQIITKGYADSQYAGGLAGWLLTGTTIITGDVVIDLLTNSKTLVYNLKNNTQGAVRWNFKATDLSDDDYYISINTEDDGFDFQPNMTLGRTFNMPPPAGSPFILRYTEQPAGIQWDDLAIPTKKYVDDNAGFSIGDGLKDVGGAVTLGDNSLSSSITLIPATHGVTNYVLGSANLAFNIIYGYVKGLYLIALDSNNDAGAGNSNFRITSDFVSNKILFSISNDTTVELIMSSTTARMASALDNLNGISVNASNTTVYLSAGVSTIKSSITLSNTNLDILSVGIPLVLSGSSAKLTLAYNTGLNAAEAKFDNTKVFLDAASNASPLTFGLITAHPNSDILEGDMYYNSTDKTFYGRTDTAWVNLVTSSGAYIKTSGTTALVDFAGVIITQKLGDFIFDFADAGNFQAGDFILKADDGLFSEIFELGGTTLGIKLTSYAGTGYTGANVEMFFQSGAFTITSSGDSGWNLTGGVGAQLKLANVFSTADFTDGLLLIVADGVTLGISNASTPTQGGSIAIQKQAASSLIVSDYSATPEGLKYAGDYTGTFVARSLVDKDYVDSFGWALTGTSTLTGTVGIEGAGYILDLGTSSNRLANFRIYATSTNLTEIESANTVTSLITSIHIATTTNAAGIGFGNIAQYVAEYDSGSQTVIGEFDFKWLNATLATLETEILLKGATGGNTRVEFASFTNNRLAVPAINLSLITGDKTNPVEGDIWYNNTTNKFRAFQNTASVDLIGGGGGGAFSADGDTQITPSTAILLDHATNAEKAFDLSHTVNKAAGNSVGLFMNVTNTASPGTLLLVDLQVGASSVFSINEFGGILAPIDTPHTIGLALMDSRTGDTLFISRIGQADITNYAIAQSSSGATNINSAAGQVLGLRIGNVVKWTISDTALTGAADQLLVLGPKADPDPTGINGMLYYNSTGNKFRAFENSAWVDLIGGGSGGAAEERVMFDSNLDTVQVIYYDETLTFGAFEIDTVRISSLEFETSTDGITWTSHGTITASGTPPAALNTWIGTNGSASWYLRLAVVYKAGQTLTTGTQWTFTR